MAEPCGVSRKMVSRRKTPSQRNQSPPTVTPNLYSGEQRCRADNVTATGFRLVIWGTATMSGSAYVQWQAIAPH